MQRLLDKNPKTRIVLPEIMIHPWVTENGTRSMQRVTNIIERGDISEEEVNFALKPTPSLRLSVKNFKSFRGQSPNANFQSPTKAPINNNNNNKPSPTLLVLDGSGNNIETRQGDRVVSQNIKCIFYYYL